MISILTTGGTIEGLEYSQSDKAPMVTPITIDEHLYQLNNVPLHDIKEVFSKDSRFINRKDRELLLREIQLSKADKILITHGTLTMLETAQYLGKQNLEN